MRLVDFDEDAEAQVLAALVYPESHRTLADLRAWAGALPAPERERIFEEIGAQRSNRRHKPPRALELASYTFDLLGDYGMYRDLHRHRIKVHQPHCFRQESRPAAAGLC